MICEVIHGHPLSVEDSILEINNSSKLLCDPSDEDCPICMNPFEDNTKFSTSNACGNDNRAYLLPNCQRHGFHKHCAARALKYNGKCPMCGYIYVMKCGVQPISGTMHISIYPPRSRYILSGYEEFGTILM